MSDEVNLIREWLAQGQQTDDGGIPIPPRMEEVAIARIRKRLFGTAPAWTDADRDVLQAVVHRITNTESVPFSDRALRQAVLDIERRMYATQATNPRAANEPTPTGEPTWALDPTGQVERLADHMNDCDGADPELPAADQAINLLTGLRERVLAMSASNREARLRINEAREVPDPLPTWNDATEALQRHIEQGYAAQSPQVQQALVKALDALTSDSRAGRKAKR